MRLSHKNKYFVGHVTQNEPFSYQVLSDDDDDDDDYKLVIKNIKRTHKYNSKIQHCFK